MTLPVQHGQEFSRLVIGLLKGVTYAESEPALWQALLQLQVRVREYVAVLGLELVLDPAEGYAYLRQRAVAEGESELPRLVPRRQLGYPLSLLLVLLRRRLAEFDAGSGEARLIISSESIADMMRLFFHESANEARFSDRMDQLINKAIELGFLQKLKGRDDVYEVRRILKTFIDAQWLGEFNTRLAEYRAHAATGGSDKEPSSL